MVSMGKWVADAFESAGVGRVVEVQLRDSSDPNILEALGLDVGSHYVTVSYERPDGGIGVTSIGVSIFHRWYWLCRILVRAEIRSILRRRAVGSREEAVSASWSWHG